MSAPSVITTAELAAAIKQLSAAQGEPSYTNDLRNVSRSFNSSHRLRRDNFGLWSSIISASLAPISGAVDHLKGREHGIITDQVASDTQAKDVGTAATKGYRIDLDKALGAMLISTLDKESIILVQHLLNEEPLGSVIYSYLKRQLRPDSASWRQGIRVQLDSFAMKTSEDVSTYIGRFASLCAEALDAGISINEEEKIRIYLRGLTSAFGVKVAAIETVIDSGSNLTLVAIQHQTRVEESRQQAQSPSQTVPQPRAAEVRRVETRSSTCAYCRKPNHQKSACMKLANDIVKGKTQAREGYQYDGPKRIDGLASHLVKPGHQYTQQGSTKKPGHQGKGEAVAWE